MSEEDKFQRERGYWSIGEKQAEILWVNAQRNGISTWWLKDDSFRLRYIEKWNQGQLVVRFEFEASEVPEGRVPEIDILTKEFKLL